MSRCLLAPVFVAILALPLVGRADAPAQSKPLFDYRETTLANGLRIITLADASCPIVAVHLWYHVGSKDERPERQGFAHMFEHMMFRGTDRLGPKDHFEYIRRCGGTCNAYTNFDQTVYVQTLPSNQLELALWLEAERMGFLKIDQTSVDTERKVVEEERRLGLNRPYGTVPEKLVRELFPGQAYGWLPIGKISHLRASAAQELRDFWLRYYVPNNATLIIVGDVQHDEAQRLAKRYFGWLPREADPPRVTLQGSLPMQARAVTIREDNAPAPAVGIVWRTVDSRHEDYVPLELLGHILGGGNSSRLYRHLVAERQLAVMALASAFSLEQAGIFGGGAVLTPLGGDTAKVLEAIRRDIEQVRTEPVTAHELLKAKNQLLASEVTQTLTVSSKATVLGSAAVLQGDVSRVNRRLDQIRRTTADDLLRVAKTYLAPERGLTCTIERNLLGSVLGTRSSEIKNEEDAAITAVPEKGLPPPARPGLRRPADFPSQPPAAKVLAGPVSLAHSEQTLPNGLKVLVVPKRQVPYVSVELGLLAGAWTETKPGTASMALSMLTRGTARHGEKELADELETYAISLGGSADLDTAAVAAGCLSEQLDRAVTMLAEVVLTPTFPKDEFEKLRKQVRTGLTVTAAEPSYKAERELRRRLYGQHPYARTTMGEIEDVDALQVSDLSSWWKTFARPDQAMLIFAGDIELARAVALAEKAFGGWKAEGPKPAVSLPAFPAASPTRIYLVDYPRGIQSQIRIGQRAIKRDNPNYPTAAVVGDYFGGAFNSRLNEVIRVQKGLTYGASGGFSPSRFTGQFTITTFSKTDSTAEAVRTALAELERLRQEAPSAKELADTKSYFLGSFARQRETPQQVAANLWMLESNSLPGDYYERLLSRVAKTEGPDCVRLARETLDPSKLAVVVVGNAAQIQKDLEKIAPVTVVKPGARPVEDAGSE
ncbi:MAG TPA: pitrilysin family protein [Gemmataceae bacterium]|nr:pitrilysin family protein [Gemmataceae bacterium]